MSITENLKLIAQIITQEINKGLGGMVLLDNIQLTNKHCHYIKPQEAYNNTKWTYSPTPRFNK